MRPLRTTGLPWLGRRRNEDAGGNGNALPTKRGEVTRVESQDDKNGCDLCFFLNERTMDFALLCRKRKGGLKAHL